MKLFNKTHILHDPSVKTCLLIDIKFDHPTVVYLLDGEMFNFNKFSHNLDVRSPRITTDNV